MASTCFHCQKALSIHQKVGLREECPFCGADLHVCKNCRFFDPQVYNECRENSAEVVREKERANFCDYFEFSSKNQTQKAGDLRNAAEALFKKK